MRSGKDYGIDEDRKEFFAICLWFLWWWRNELTFQNMRTTLEEQISLVERYVREVRTTFSARTIIHGGEVRVKTIWIGWSPT